MIIDSEGMKKTEESSGIPVYDLMCAAGRACAAQIEKDTAETDHVLIIAGKGNNGGDGYVIAKELKRTVRLYAPFGSPKTPEALKAKKEMPSGILVRKKDIDKLLEDADVIIDCVFGFSYHGDLTDEIRSLFRRINRMRTRVISIDINSGCEADTGHCDKDALHSDLTYALEMFKPFHMLRREHRMFRKAIVVPLGLPHPETTDWMEMDEETFFAGLAKKSENAYKGADGKILIAGGGYGMAGAVMLNILGARTMGCSYIHAAVPTDIYHIAASRFMTAVYHPFYDGNYQEKILEALQQADAVAFGSGAVNMPRKRDCMDLILQNSKVPVILDAEGLRLMVHNTYLFRFIHCPVILTPHIGEFAALLNRDVSEVRDGRIRLARAFAKENNVYVVLKGADTVVASPDGKCYINQSGNPALAQAGSGDLLTGIMAACLASQPDVFHAVCMAVYIHGHIADLGLKEMSVRGFDLEAYPSIMDRLFQKYGY